MKNKILLFIVFLMLFSCSKTLVMSDEELQKAQTERTKSVMLNHNQLIIPPDFEIVPTESESQYVVPPDNRTLLDKIIKLF